MIRPMANMITPMMSRALPNGTKIPPAAGTETLGELRMISGKETTQIHISWKTQKPPNLIGLLRMSSKRLSPPTVQEAWSEYVLRESEREIRVRAGRNSLLSMRKSWNPPSRTAQTMTRTLAAMLRP